MAGAGVDVGSIIQFPVTQPPAKFLECNGAAISRASYSKLFDVIGVMYGAGDGSSTFNLPDYRGRFLRGTAGGSGNDPDRSSRTNRGDGIGGDNVGTKQGHLYGSHSHSYGASLLRYGGSSHSFPSGSNASTDSGTSTSGGNETRPLNINVLLCIKY